MIRISRIYRTILPIEKERISQVREIFRQNFSAVADYADKISDIMENPIRYGYTSVLLVSEKSLGRVTGFSLFFYFPVIKFALLDFMAVSRDVRGEGTGAALYEATREHLMQMNCSGLFLEALPDDPRIVTDPVRLKENQMRLRFYEGYGVRPIIGTEYETPIGTAPAPHLLYDDLGRAMPLHRGLCRAVMRTILEKKYSHLVSPQYIKRVVNSVKDEPVRIREPKYIKRTSAADSNHYKGWLEKAFVMVSSMTHEIHHVHERGYVERPARVRVIQASLEFTGLFEQISCKRFEQKHILAVHDGDFVGYLKAVCQKLQSKRPVYPYVFPVRRPERRPKDLAVRAGYYCIDTFTPLDRNAYEAARSSVDVAMTAAEQTIKGKPVVYAICRPPGHHAGKRTFGGFCYFNNAAIAANFLSGYGKVAVLDIDFHHCNGTQDIFYNRSDVLTVSIHGHPNIAYPYFSGFRDETGEADGRGFNLNLPLQENAGEDIYLQALRNGLAHIKKFSPSFLVVSLGFDTMKSDPTGSFGLRAETMRKIGSEIAALNLPVLVVQEGGYNLRNLKTGSAAFFGGVAEALSYTHNHLVKLREIKT